jgi:hypothetical protein
MPLSEHEQRMLDQIERALYEDDPKFANSVDERRIRRRRPVIAGIGFLIGLICLVSGVMLAQRALGFGVAASVLGFLLMVGGVGLLVFGQPTSAGRTSASGSKKPPSNLSDRMEQRFRRRFDQE